MPSQRKSTQVLQSLSWIQEFLKAIPESRRWQLPYNGFRDVSLLHDKSQHTIQSTCSSVCISCTSFAGSYGL